MVIGIDEFCNELKIQKEHGQFRCFRPQFYKTIAKDGKAIYNFSDGSGVIKQFKLMPEYEETWTRTVDTTVEPATYTLWNTYKVW